MEQNNKELDKRLISFLKKNGKEFGYKKRENILYKKSGEYLLTMTVQSIETLGGENTNGLKIKATGQVKPFILDDVFWKVFGMPDNVKQHISLRAIGAFTVVGAPLFEQTIEIDNHEDIEIVAKELLKTGNEKMESHIAQFGNDFTKFAEYAKTLENPGAYNPVLTDILLEINEGNLTEAEKIAQHELENESLVDLPEDKKLIYEHVIDFITNGYKSQLKKILSFSMNK